MLNCNKQCYKLEIPRNILPITIRQKYGTVSECPTNFMLHVKELTLFVQLEVYLSITQDIFVTDIFNSMSKKEVISKEKR